MLLITLDTFRRTLFGEARPIDMTMLIIELLVLLLILAEFVRGMWTDRANRRELREEISGLTPEETDGLMNWILSGDLPNDGSVVRAIAARGLTEVREFGGLVIARDSRYPLLKRWAKKRSKRRS